MHINTVLLNNYIWVLPTRDSSFRHAKRDCIRNDRVFFNLSEKRSGSPVANHLSFPFVSPKILSFRALARNLIINYPKIIIDNRYSFKINWYNSNITNGNHEYKIPPRSKINKLICRIYDSLL
jgi:hypothetical protein